MFPRGKSGEIPRAKFGTIWANKINEIVFDCNPNYKMKIHLWIFIYLNNWILINGGKRDKSSMQKNAK